MAICPYATWKPVKNFNVGMTKPPKGVALHITSTDSKGNLPTLPGLFGEFNTRSTWKSAQFAISKSGNIWQFVDTDNRAWAIDGNVIDMEWISIENIAKIGETLTDSQVSSCATVYAWLQDFTDIPLALADKPGDSGLGSHSMFGDPNRKLDPGAAILGQRQTILDLAKDMSSTLNQ